MTEVPSSPHVPYEPPSPTRPWQLIDVLWQPLPPPSHSRYPTSPVSPNKRRAADPGEPRIVANGHGHRRASSSMSSSYVYTDPYPSSPVRELREGEKKRRSQSHSHHPSRTTTQDVDAAKALTSMLGSTSRRSSTQAPLLPPVATTSLPLPTSPHHPPRPRAYSVTASPDFPSPRPSSSRPSDLRTPSSHTRNRISSDLSEDAERGEDDKTAAELMMFLAHSPSPMKRFALSAARTSGTARVLFADGDEAAGGKVAQHSKLAAPPISAGLEDRKKEGIFSVNGPR